MKHICKKYFDKHAFATGIKNGITTMRSIYILYICPKASEVSLEDILIWTAWI